MVEIICDYCKNSFLRKKSEIVINNFCSRHCYSQYKKNNSVTNIKNVTCHICKTMFYRKKSGIKDINFCSKQCDYVYRKTLIGDKACNYKNKLLVKICEMCKNEFCTYTKKQKACSLKCGNDMKKSRVVLICAKCECAVSKPISYYHWAKVRNVKKFFCSVSCRASFYSKEGSSSWIKDRTKLKNRYKSERNCSKVSDWRKAVFIRDGYTCQMCNSKSEKGNPVVLNAHHIIRFNKRIDLRTDINNGITLCEPCHKKTYKKEEQYEDYFNLILKNKNESC